MPKTKSRTENTYTVVPIKDGSYGVRVSPPSFGPSSTINGYRTEGEAEADIPRLKAIVRHSRPVTPRIPVGGLQGTRAARYAAYAAINNVAGAAGPPQCPVPHGRRGQRGGWAIAQARTFQQNAI
jgi:hypothetical protein